MIIPRGHAQFYIFADRSCRCHLDTAAESSGVAGSDLLSALYQVPDPRAPRGARHSMSAILAVALYAVQAGARSFTAIGQWAANASGQVLAALGVASCLPSESCLRRTLQRLQGDRLDAVLDEWASCQTSRRGARRVVAADGKTVRGSRSAQAPARHLMAAIDHHAGVVIGQVDVPGKTNEIPMFSQLCDQITDLEGVVVTADRDALPKRPRRLSRAGPPRALPPDRQRQPASTASPAQGPTLVRRPPPAYHTSRGHGAHVAIAAYRPAWWPSNTQLLIRRVALDPGQGLRRPRPGAAEPCTPTSAPCPWASWPVPVPSTGTPSS